ncbi:MAG: hypothetical protein KIT09_19845 [Bryobacteraceae bacterium]|nr:hypothetical protein [Bryobacteraceae bacterium]
MTGAIALQFVTPPWQSPHDLKRRRGLEIIEAAPDQFRTLQIVPPHEALGLVPVPRVIVGWKQYFHLTKININPTG